MTSAFETTPLRRTASETPALTRDEELRLARLWRDHRDPAAGSALVTAHLRDVVFVALKNQHYGFSVEELIAEGTVGLVHARDCFDPDQGVRFSTYAGHWLRAHMISHILRSWTLVRNSSGVVRSKVFFQLRRERARAATLHGEGPEVVQEVARRMQLPVARVTDLLSRLDTRDLSLDAPGEEQPSALERLAAEGTAEDALLSAQVESRRRIALSEALNLLDERERAIIEQRYFNVDEAPSLAELGRKYGISRERARQLEERAKRKLREFIEGRLDPDILFAA